MSPRSQFTRLLRSLGRQVAKIIMISVHYERLAQLGDQ